MTVRTAASPGVTGRSSVLLLVIALALAGCSRKSVQRAVGEEPKVAATVVTIRTVTKPENKAYHHSMFIADGVVRSGDEVDVWHLYDPAKNRVTTVDEIAGTHRVFTVQDLVALRRKSNEARGIHVAANAVFADGSGAVVTLGVQTKQSLITAGAYRRELSIGKHPQIPARLFPLMYLTRLAESAAAGVSPRVDDALLKIDGYPLIDKSDLPYGKSTMAVERTVVKVEQKQVPRAWFELPKKSRDITPPPAKKRR
jgi:hypothetical protein